MKRLLLILILITVLVVGCQQAAKQEVLEGVPEVVTTPEVVTETPEVETTGEQVVDDVGNDLNDISSVEDDLSIDDLEDLDSVLNDIENI